MFHRKQKWLEGEIRRFATARRINHKGTCRLWNSAGARSQRCRWKMERVGRDLFSLFVRRTVDYSFPCNTSVGRDTNIEEHMVMEPIRLKNDTDPLPSPPPCNSFRFPFHECVIDENSWYGFDFDLHLFWDVLSKKNFAIRFWL